MRQQGGHQAHEDQADAGFLQTGNEAGPALRPMTPMKIHRPTVSKIQIAGRGFAE